jgi:hypothetical protein
MMEVRKIISLLLAIPLVFIAGYAYALGTTNADLEDSYHGALGHHTADVTDATPSTEQGMLEKW